MRVGSHTRSLYLHKNTKVQKATQAKAAMTRKETAILTLMSIP